MTMSILSSLASTDSSFAQLTSLVAVNSNFNSLSTYVNDDELDFDRLTTDIIDKVKQPELAQQNLSHYQDLINKYLGQDFRPKTLAEIVPDPKLTTNVVAEFLEAERKALDETAMTQVQQLCCNISDGEACENIGNSFAKLSAGKFVLDQAAIARHLQFMEMARNIPLSEISRDPIEVASKIISYFVECRK